MKLFCETPAFDGIAMLTIGTFFIPKGMEYASQFSKALAGLPSSDKQTIFTNLVNNLVNNFGEHHNGEQTFSVGNGTSSGRG